MVAHQNQKNKGEILSPQRPQRCIDPKELKMSSVIKVLPPPPPTQEQVTEVMRRMAVKHAEALRILAGR